MTLNSTVPGIVDISWDAPDQTPANYRVSWAKAGEPYLTWTDPAGNAFPTVPFHTITGLEEGGEYRMPKVRASYSGTSGDWSDEVTATVAESPVVPNTPATGMPVITGTVQVGHTLTADISGIADADGITGVSFNYLWISDNGTDETEIGGGGGLQDGVAASRHVLTADDLGDTIKVRVAFTDDAGHAESLTQCSHPQDKGARQQSPPHTPSPACLQTSWYHRATAAASLKSPGRLRPRTEDQT